MWYIIESINFYWIDINEDTYNEPGQIYLFGKVMNYKTKQYESCSVVIKDFWRTVYFLPHSAKDNSEEVNPPPHKQLIIQNRKCSLNAKG